MDSSSGAGVTKVLLTPEEAAAQLNIGRTMMFALLKSGEVGSVRIGRLRRVPTTEIDLYARRLVEQQCGRVGHETISPQEAA